MARGRAGLGAEVEGEVEALRAVYGADVGVSAGPAPPPAAAEVRVGPLGPRAAGGAAGTGGEPGPAFVKATLALLLPTGYPDVPAVSRLEPPLGALGEERAACMGRALGDLAQELAGDGAPQLLVLCDQLQDLLGAANFPLGPCSVCLELLAPEPDPAARAAAGCVRLGSCGHCFHRRCLRAWLRWCDTQEAQPVPPGQPLARRAAEPGARLGAYRCPLCRAPVGEAEAAEVLGGGAGARGRGRAPAPERGAEEVGARPGEPAAARALRAERGAQRARRARFEQQQACGGIIDTRPIELAGGGGISLLRTTVESSHRRRSGETISAPAPAAGEPARAAQDARGGGRAGGRGGRGPGGPGRGRGRGRGGGGGGGGGRGRWRGRGRGRGAGGGAGGGSRSAVPGAPTTRLAASPPRAGGA